MFDFDLPTVDQVENFNKTGGMLPPGKYHVRLDGAKDITSSKGTQGTELILTVLTGPNTGHEIKETLYRTESDALKQRLVMFGAALGVLARDGKGFKKIEGIYGFADRLGADCVVEVQHEEYTNKEGKKGKVAKCTFNGCWPTNHPDVKSVAKAPKVDAAKKDSKVDTSGL